MSTSNEQHSGHGLALRVRARLVRLLPALTLLVVPVSCKPVAQSFGDLQPKTPPASAPPASPLQPGGIPRSPVRAQVREVRGVWLTNVDSNVLESAASIDAALGKLASLGFTTVYPVVWNRGYTLYPSPVAERVLGAAAMPDSPYSTAGRDMLKECVEAAARHGLEVIPWFEYGLKLPADHPLARRNPGWFTETLDGAKSRTDGIPVSYLNPALPEVGTFLRELVVDLVKRYNVAGIQFDDHFSMWNEFGYDAGTLREFQSQNGSTTRVPPPRDAKWKAFRAGKITALLSSIVGAARAERPGLIISLSSNIYPWSLDNHLQDWPAWIRQGLADEFALQNYHVGYPRYLSDMASYKRTDTAPAAKPYTVMGILSGIKTRRVSALDIERRIVAAREKGFGVVFFFYGSLFDLIPEGETADGRQAVFQRQFALPSYPRRPPP